MISPRREARARGDDRVSARLLLQLVPVHRPGADEIEAVGADTGVTMWHGVGWIAGLLAIALIVWQAIRLANIELEIGVTPVDGHRGARACSC